VDGGPESREDQAEFPKAEMLKHPLFNNVNVPIACLRQVVRARI
jgi:hypothetical protein